MGFEGMPRLARGVADIGSLGAAAAAARARGDAVAEESALRGILAIEKRNLGALTAIGELLAARGDRRGARSYFNMALQVAQATPNVSPALHARLAAAQSYVAQVQAELAEELAERLELSGVRRGSVSGRVADSLDLLFGRKPLYVQQPNMFYFPGLAQRPFFERDEFDWIGEVEAEAPAILAELHQLMADEAAFGPHVVDNDRLPPTSNLLLNNPQWSACHLWQRGRELTEHTARLPATRAALQLPPVPYISRFSPMVMFSLLRPGTHIVPHHGVTNTRLICHLPLLAPAGCTLRVGAESREWHFGKTLIFDDSFEHEAWNRGADTRVVLLFEIWRPDIGAAERAELSTLFELVEMGEGGDSYA
jgi:hypothetical protein